jgi:hypothetical protein
MIKPLAFAVVPLLTALTLSSTSLASQATPLRFTIEPSRNADEVELSFRWDGNDHWNNNWNSSFRMAQLAGLDPAVLNGAAARPIRFAIAREAGRIDCAGTGAHAEARGTCNVTPDADFMSLLSRHGIAQPDEDHMLGLIALDVHRTLIETLAAAHFPTPSVNQLMALTAVGATPDYISELGAAGYHPKSLEGLVQFAALKITPDYIGSFVRAGYTNLPPEELIQMKALNITPDFLSGFERLGYRHLPVGTLVQLKALDITPAFARSARQDGTLPSPERLVQLRVLGR